MELIDPAPIGYKWWVGVGNVPIQKKGIYNAYPEVYAGMYSGDYHLEYMIGDSFNGLNFLRSEKKDIRVLTSKSASDLVAYSNNQSVELQWTAPLNFNGLVGYDIYRNHHKINSEIVQTPEYKDETITTGSYTYTVIPLYLHKKYGQESVPAHICFAHQGTSMDFDGQNDRIIVFDDPSLQIKGMITLEAWIKIKDTDSKEPRIISKGANGKGYELFLKSSENGYRLAFLLKSGLLESKTILTSHNWYHIAATYDGVYMKLYINGQLSNYKKIYGHLHTSDSPLLIGKSSTSASNYFYGDIDEVRIWRTCRTAVQINNFNNRNLSGQENGLVGCWQMKEGCSFTTSDLSKEHNNGYLQGSCWCSEEFPFVEETNSMTNPELIVPIMNYKAVDRRPYKIEMEFKFNPKLLKFQGINKQNTQIENFKKVLTQCSPDGVIRITALNYNHNMMEGDVLVYLDFKALQKKVNTTLDFQACKTDGVLMRTMSAKIIADAAGWKAENIAKATNQEQSIGLNVFPNPAKNFVNIKISEIRNEATLQIINVAGQIVYTETIAPQEFEMIYTVDLSQFTEGLYIINLRHENEMSVKKLAIH